MGVGAPDGPGPSNAKAQRLADVLRCVPSEAWRRVLNCVDRCSLRLVGDSEVTRTVDACLVRRLNVCVGKHYDAGRLSRLLRRMEGLGALSVHSPSWGGGSLKDVMDIVLNAGADRKLKELTVWLHDDSRAENPGAEKLGAGTLSSAAVLPCVEVGPGVASLCQLPERREL